MLKFQQNTSIITFKAPEKQMTKLRKFFRHIQHKLKIKDLRANTVDQDETAHYEINSVFSISAIVGFGQGFLVHLYSPYIVQYPTNFK